MSVLLVPDGPHGYVLIKDGTIMSYVNPHDPTDMGRMDHLKVMIQQIDAMPPGRLQVVHIGGGAMTLARYIEHTRPDSNQCVVEPDRDVTDLVEEKLPLPKKSAIFPVYIRGEQYLRVAKKTDEDLVIMDAFDVFDTPPALTTVECFTDVKRILKPGGTMIANVINDWQSYVAMVERVFGDVIALGNVPVLSGKEKGNVIVVARKDS